MLSGGRKLSVNYKYAYYMWSLVGYRIKYIIEIPSIVMRDNCITLFDQASMNSLSSNNSSMLTNHFEASMNS